MSEIGPDVVFLGPSLSHEEAGKLLPDAIVLPPAGMGDVLSALEQYKPHAIALIDGSFLQNMSVFHKELVDAMSRGVWVIGASSMGALRAAECASFGMIPVGEIAHAYLRGELHDDDEVALAHASAAEGFRPLSDAMVDIRATLRGAVEANLLSEGEADLLNAAQKARYFPDRSVMGTCRDARSLLGWSEDRIQAYERHVRTNRVELKRRDACAALHALAALPAGPIPQSSRPVLVESGPYLAMASTDRVVQDAGRPVQLEDIRTHAALTDPEFLLDRSIARQRVALILLSDALGLEVSDDALVAARRSVARRFGVPVDELDVEAAALDMTAAELASLVENEARIAAMEDYSAAMRHREGMSVPGHLEVLRLRRKYRKFRAGAAGVEQRAASSEERDIEPPFVLSLLQHQGLAGFEVFDRRLDEWIEATGFESAAQLYDRLVTHLVAERAMFAIPVGVGLDFDETTMKDIDHSSGEFNARGAR